MALTRQLRAKVRVPPLLWGAIGLVLAGAVYYFAYYGPTAARTMAALAEASRLEVQVQVLSRARQALPQARETLRALQARQASTIQRTLRLQDLPAGAGFVSDAAAAMGMRLVTLTYSLQGEPAAGGAVHFDVQVEGPYAGLVRFIEAMEHAFDQVQFSALDVSAAPGSTAAGEQAAPASPPVPRIGTGGTPAGTGSADSASAERATSDRMAQVAALFSYLQTMALQKSGATSEVPAPVGAGGAADGATSRDGMGASAGAGTMAPSAAGSAGSALVRAMLGFSVPVRVAAEPGTQEVPWKAPALATLDALGSQAGTRPAVINPFAPSDRASVETRFAQASGTDALDLRVTGIAQGPGGLVAVLIVAGRSHVVREGTRLGALEVVAVRPDGLEVRAEQQRVFVPLRAGP